MLTRKTTSEIVWRLCDFIKHGFVTVETVSPKEHFVFFDEFENHEQGCK